MKPPNTSPKRASTKGRAGINWEAVHQRLERAQATINDLTQPDAQKRKQILRERAASLARPANLAAGARADADSLEVLEFMLAGERYALEAAYIAHVYPYSLVTPLPGLPGFVVGIIAAQAEVLSVIDLRSLLNLPLSRLVDPASIIVLKNSTMEFGVLAEEVLGIHRIPVESIEQQLPTLPKSTPSYLLGVSASRTAILSASQLLCDSRLVIKMD